MARGAYPRITWGASFANTLDVGAPLDRAINYPNWSEGSEVRETPAGTRDPWLMRREHILEGTLRWIPIANMASPLATGWDGATGVRAFLDWAASNQFRWIPNRTSPGTFQTMWLLEPIEDIAAAVSLESNHRYRSLRIVMRTADDSAIEGY